MPSDSAIDIIVEAVPITMQVPADRAKPDSRLFQSSSDRLPARRSACSLNTSVPEPRVLPRQWPRSMAPAGR